MTQNTEKQQIFTSEKLEAANICCFLLKQNKDHLVFGFIFIIIIIRRTLSPVVDHEWL